jgi:uncharacterized repeat protein (TIGR03803 family)
MQTHRHISLQALLGIVALCVSIGAHAQTLSTLYTFTGGTNGANPHSRLVMDSNGNLYGITQNGGVVTGNCSLGCGTVYELTRNGNSWTQTVLYSFTGENGDGNNPWSLTIDSAGNLFGVTTWGGASNTSVCGPETCGTVFELTPSASGWTEKVIYSFQGGPSDGNFPFSNIVVDAKGNLYGTTVEGGIGTNPMCYGTGCGTVWELSPTTDGRWKERIIHNFLGMGYGQNPWGGVTMDAAGNLYGDTAYGGNSQRGTVFKLSPTKTGWIGGVIFRLRGNASGGSQPNPSLAIDSHGNIFGSSPAPESLVFELSPSASGWTQSIIATFPQNGPIPYDGMTSDSKGNIYGTTSDSVFELENISGSLQLVTLATMDSNNQGTNPGLPIFDAKGNLYGADWLGFGTAQNGAVYEIIP